MTLTAYAKRRGVSKMAVSHAVKSGRLVHCVVRGPDGRARGISDPDLADREWDQNTDHSRAPDAVKAHADASRSSRFASAVQVLAQPATAENRGARLAAAFEVEDLGAGIPPESEASPPSEAGGVPLLSESSAREKHWKAKKAELDYRERAGELVPVARVANAFRDRCARVRTKLLGLPARARSQMPHLTLADVATLEQVVREALEELSEEPPK